jgi:hypothetical protein
VITLLVSPYLYNYDFILLLVPFAVLINSNVDMSGRIVVIACYLVPTFVIAIWGRPGNISLIIVALVLALLLYLSAKKQALTLLPIEHKIEPIKYDR